MEMLDAGRWLDARIEDQGDSATADFFRKLQFMWKKQHLSGVEYIQLQYSLSHGTIFIASFLRIFISHLFKKTHLVIGTDRGESRGMLRLAVGTAVFLGLASLGASRPASWRASLLRLPLRLLEGEGPAAAPARATRDALLEQLLGALRRPEFLLNHDVRPVALAPLVAEACAFPFEALSARPLERADPVADPRDADGPSTRSAAAARVWERLRSVFPGSEVPPPRVSPAHPLLEPLLRCPGFSPGVFFGSTPNLGLLTHCALALSLAAYSVAVNDDLGSLSVRREVSRAIGRVIPGDRTDVGASEPSERARMLAGLAVGGVTVNSWLLRSELACGVAVLDHQGVLAVSFRGTLEASDVLTDLAFAPARFSALSRNSAGEDEAMLVHGGFLAAFSSLLPQLDRVIADASVAGSIPRLFFTGHSMGGAVAQLAAAHYHLHSPWLVTFGAPSLGNSAFVRHVEDFVRPFGGLRLWNELDSVPYLAQLVGYRHAGVPVKLRLSPLAKNVLAEQLGGPGRLNADLLRAVAPHIAYHVGAIVYVFPIIGSNATVAENWLHTSGA